MLIDRFQTIKNSYNRDSQFLFRKSKMIYTLILNQNNNLKAKKDKEGMSPKMKNFNKWTKTYRKNLTFSMKYKKIIKSN